MNHATPNNVPGGLALPVTVGNMDDFILGVDGRGLGYASMKKKERQGALQVIVESNDVANNLGADGTFIPFDQILSVETWEHLPALHVSWEEPGRKGTRKLPFTLASIDQARGLRAYRRRCM
jgi:hypothetical protein